MCRWRYYCGNGIHINPSVAATPNAVIDDDVSDAGWVLGQFAAVLAMQVRVDADDSVRSVDVDVVVLKRDQRNRVFIVQGPDEIALADVVVADFCAVDRHRKRCILSRVKSDDHVSVVVDFFV